MLSSAQSDSNHPRTWSVEFSDGRLVKVNRTTGRNPNCEGETCGEYFALNGYEAKTLPNSGSFATLGIKKSISKVSGFGNNNPEIQGGGAVNILFCSQVGKNLSSSEIKDSEWGTKVCPNGWKIVRDERKNGKEIGTDRRGKRTGKGWYIIGFIWDANTQYFGFIKETDLFSKVLSEKLVKGGITIDKGDTKSTELFADTFKDVLNTPVGSVSCLHFSRYDKGPVTSTCSSWNAWKDTIAMPMGYNGKDQIAKKKLSEADLVIIPVDQIRVKDGKFFTIFL